MWALAYVYATQFCPENEIQQSFSGSSTDDSFLSPLEQNPIVEDLG